MKKFMCTAAVVAFSLYATAQEKADSAKIDILLLPNVELNEVNVLGTWAQKNDPVAQINLTQKDIEALNTGRDLPYVLQDVAGVVSFSDAAILLSQVSARATKAKRNSIICSKTYVRKDSDPFY